VAKGVEAVTRLKNWVLRGNSAPVNGFEGKINYPNRKTVERGQF